MHCLICPQKYKLRGRKGRQRKEISKTAAFIFVLLEAASTSHKQILLSKSSTTWTAVTGGLLICCNALAGQESVISDSWNCKDLRWCEVFALIHLIYHLLPANAGNGVRCWTDLSRSVMKHSRWSGMRHTSLFPQTGTYVETSCFQELWFGNCLQSFPKFWLQMVQEKMEGNEGQKGKQSAFVVLQICNFYCSFMLGSRQAGHPCDTQVTRKCDW